MTIQTLVIASRNPHKSQELRDMLSGLPITVKDMRDFPDCPEVEEDGETLQENALKKARAVHACTGLPVIADDTGLEVDYLLGEPGVYSARFAGEDATYADNVRLLLERLQGVPARRRSARFRSVIAFIGQGIERLFEGRIEGTIAESGLGTNGFGYDPVFVPDGSTRTYAELSADEKNAISHRAKALAAFREFLAA